MKTFLQIHLSLGGRSKKVENQNGIDFEAKGGVWLGSSGVGGQEWRREAREVDVEKIAHFLLNNLFLASANFPAVPALQARNQLVGYKSSKTWSKQEGEGGRREAC